jgi:glycosyltransferase involved in cell wall biosynthesis
VAGIVPERTSKITILILVDAMSSGGMERQIVELLRGMRARESCTFHLGVLAEGHSRLLEAEQLAGAVLSLRRAEDASWAIVRKLPYFLWKTIRESANAKIAIVHTFGCFSDIIGLAVGRTLGIPVINGSIRSARPKLTYRDQVSRMCMRLSNKIVANSRAGILSFGFDEADEKNQVIHNGVDLKRFDNVSFIKKTQYFTICMVANFTWKKDHNSLIRIIPELRKIINSLTVCLVGKGESLNNVRQLISDLQLDDVVTIIADCDHPEPFIASADLCMLLSYTEGISNSILEYMALKKPVIASDCGGNREVVVHGTTGYLVPENDPGLLTQHVVELFFNPERGHELGRNGRRKLEQEFELNAMVDQYQKLYEQIADMNPNGTRF